MKHDLKFLCMQAEQMRKAATILLKNASALEARADLVRREEERGSRNQGLPSDEEDVDPLMAKS